MIADFTPPPPQGTFQTAQPVLVGVQFAGLDLGAGIQPGTEAKVRTQALKELAQAKKVVKSQQ